MTITAIRSAAVSPIDTYSHLLLLRVCYSRRSLSFEDAEAYVLLERSSTFFDFNLVSVFLRENISRVWFDWYRTRCLQACSEGPKRSRPCVSSWNSANPWRCLAVGAWDPPNPPKTKQQVRWKSSQAMMWIVCFFSVNSSFFTNLTFLTLSSLVFTVLFLVSSCLVCRWSDQGGKQSNRSGYYLTNQRNPRKHYDQS